MNKKENSERFDFFLVLAIVLISGNPILTNNIGMDFLYVILLLLLFFKKTHLKHFTFNKKKTNQLLGIILFFVIILIIQFFSSSNIYFYTNIGFLLKIIVGWFVIITINNFWEKFIKVILSIGKISLLFYFPRLLLDLLFGFDIANIFQPLIDFFAHHNSDHIFIYNFDTITRNAALFGEAGLFAAHLIYALIFLIINKNKYQKKKFRNYFLLLSIMLFTTLSTTAYTLYLLILLLYFNFSIKENKKYLFARIVLYILTITSITIYFIELDFMQGKIAHQLEQTQAREGNFHTTRFGNFVVDYEYFKKKPLFGYGINKNLRYSNSISQNQIIDESGGGLSSIFVYFGLVGFIFITWLLYDTFRKFEINKMNSFFITLIIFGTLVGQPMISYPIFFVLLFNSSEKNNSLLTQL
jgi:hypothetical protein